MTRTCRTPFIPTNSSAAMPSCSAAVSRMLSPGGTPSAMPWSATMPSRSVRTSDSATCASDAFLGSRFAPPCAACAASALRAPATPRRFSSTLSMRARTRAWYAALSRSTPHCHLSISSFSSSAAAAAPVPPASPPSPSSVAPSSAAAATAAFGCHGRGSSATTMPSSPMSRAEKRTHLPSSSTAPSPYKAPFSPLPSLLRVAQSCPRRRRRRATGRRLLSRGLLPLLGRESPHECLDCRGLLARYARPGRPRHVPLQEARVEPRLGARDPPRRPPRRRR